VPQEVEVPQEAGLPQDVPQLAISPNASIISDLSEDVERIHVKCSNGYITIHRNSELIVELWEMCKNDNDVGWSHSTDVTGTSVDFINLYYRYPEMFTTNGTVQKTRMKLNLWKIVYSRKIGKAPLFFKNNGPWESIFRVCHSGGLHAFSIGPKITVITESFETPHLYLVIYSYGRYSTITRFTNFRGLYNFLKEETTDSGSLYLKMYEPVVNDSFFLR
jgi:hypothetical protein